MKKRIILTPVAGLANRMRAIASTYLLAQKLGMELVVYWFKDKEALNASFGDLFEYPDVEDIKVVDGNIFDLLRFGNYRKRLLWMPVIYKKLFFEMAFNDHQQDRFLPQMGKVNGDVFISSCSFIGKHSKDELSMAANKVLVLRKELRDKVASKSNGFGKHTIGFHIRRTDNVFSIEGSPSELFYEAAEKELAQYPDTTLFLASDSIEEKNLFKQRFPQLITDLSEASRDNLHGIEDGLIDMFLLSKCSTIYGSFYSSFSEFASIIGNSNLEVLRRG